MGRKCLILKPQCRELQQKLQDALSKKTIAETKVLKLERELKELKKQTTG